MLLVAPALAAQPQPADILPDSVRERLQIELREMIQTDQRVRTMAFFGTFSPCVADSLDRELSALPIGESVTRRTELSDDADARLSPAEKAFLLQSMQDADLANLTRLRAMIAAYGWPSAERTGSDVNPIVLLIHAPQVIGEMTPVLLAEVQAGHLSARHFAMVLDKSRKVRGELQLYGTADEFRPETQTVGPPRIASIDATNAARRAIGLPDLDAYEIVDPE